MLIFLNLSSTLIILFSYLIISINLLSGLLGSDDTLDNLLLLKKESTKDAINIKKRMKKKRMYVCGFILPLTNATGALGATVGTGDGLLTLGEESIASGSEDGDTGKRAAAVTATDTLGGLCSVVDGELVAGGADSPVSVGLGVVAVLSAVGETGDHFL